jgi:nucleotide-binding universal stress UspA family protein
MLPIHTILHPTDFSDHSMNACRLACALARDYGATLIVMHVAQQISLIYGETIVPSDADLHLGQARDRLLQLDVPDAGINVQRRIEDGDPIIEILRMAEETQADLIVMGTHGRRGLKRILMGSVAEGVTRKARCPVLTVRTPFADESLVHKEVVAAEAG